MLRNKTLLAMLVLVLAGCRGGDDPQGLPAGCWSLAGESWLASYGWDPEACGQASVEGAFRDGDLYTNDFVSAPPGCRMNLYASAKLQDTSAAVFPAGTRAGAYIRRSANVSAEDTFVGTYLKGAHVRSAFGNSLTFIPAGPGTGADEYVYIDTEQPYDEIVVSFDNLDGASAAVYEICAEKY